MATKGEQQIVTHTDEGTGEHSALSTPLPRPTYWPVVMAAGIVFMTWGIATTLAISAIGLALFALALGGWIGEWRHGH